MGKVKHHTYPFTHTTHTHTPTHTGILVLGWMCLSYLTQNMSYCLFMISHQVRGDAVCARVCVCLCVCVVPLWWFVCVFTLMRMSWLSKDWNKASKSKRQGLLHRRVQVPTLWGELKCVRERASDERQHYFRDREKTTTKNRGTEERIWQAAQKSCSESTKPPQCLEHLHIDCRYRDRSRNDFDIWRGVFIYWYKVQWE